ncbi:hypothetical protein [Methylobacterium haplocladii]|uniref:PepSY domain-containing protein n=2 Tax=Methylobacterium haplocladii TaxID=1176176 RepID=A0A512ITC7_9HYPH|nr:hypothetical protein [Methylobacterium haplocladii]GEP00926.1 hypothetical protein MHA02_33130 [Methylobacterium haplocladii]GLS58842.1 hypothetical protein GCM10007887_15080 [Methylobacterium haplocladii]
MHRSLSIRRALIGAAVLSLFAAGDASAQFAYGYMRTYPGPAYEDELPPIPPRAVVYRLQDRGFTEIARPRFDGRAYVVEATNPAGSRVRLFVDVREGGVIGRERLDTPYYPSGRVARSAPGYGWTEEDVVPRRAARTPEGLLPPADIPLPRPSLHAEIDRAPGVSPRPGAPDANTFGVNPEARGGTRGDAGKGDKARAAAAQRRTAKLTQPVKPAAPSGSPEAPIPQTTTSSEPTKPDAAKPLEAAKPPEAAKAVVEPPKTEPAPLTPAANQPVAAEKPSAPQATEAPVAEKPAVEKPAEDRRADKAIADKGGANQGWQDPPAGDPKRNVRVIGGAIVVPGGGEAAPATAN